MMRKTKHRLRNLTYGLNYQCKSFQWPGIFMLLFGICLSTLTLALGGYLVMSHWGRPHVGVYQLKTGDEDAISRAAVNTTSTFEDMAERRAVAKRMDPTWPPEEPQWVSKFRKDGSQANAQVLQHRRNPEDFSSEILAYIAQLDITDPVFYDVFTDPEIYSFFHPESEITGPRIPFYIWDDTGDILKAVACSAPNSDFTDSFKSFYMDLKDHPWRTFNKDEALFFYVPLPDAFLQGYSDSCHPPPEVMKLVVNDILASPEWKRYNGMNFFWAGTNYRNDIAERGVERSRMNGVISSLSSHHQFLMQAIPFFEASNTHLQSCQVMLPFAPPWITRSERHFPKGRLEGYQQDLGESFMLRRPINFFFMGQADDRGAYWSRRKAIEDLSDTTGLSMLASTSKGSKNKGHVEVVDVVTGCGEYTNSTEHFECLMRLSMFGLHLRGDEFSSGRLAALIGAGTVPIIVMEEAQDIMVPAQCNVPWQDLAIFVNETAWKANATEALRVALDPLTPQDMAKRYRLVEYYREYSVNGLWWNKFSTYVLQQAARRCIPERILRDHGLERRKLVCPFEDRIVVQAFTPVTPDHPDEDDPQPPWGAHWVCQGNGEECNRKPTSEEDMAAARGKSKKRALH